MGSIDIAGHDSTSPMSTEDECNHSDTGSGDREKETVSKETLNYPHDRTPLFDQTIDCDTDLGDR
jgi:hypothetical protein